MCLRRCNTKRAQYCGTERAFSLPDALLTSRCPSRCLRYPSHHRPSPSRRRPIIPGVIVPEPCIVLIVIIIAVVSVIAVAGSVLPGGYQRKNDNQQNKAGNERYACPAGVYPFAGGTGFRGAFLRRSRVFSRCICISDLSFW